MVHQFEINFQFNCTIDIHQTIDINAEREFRVQRATNGENLNLKKSEAEKVGPNTCSRLLEGLQVHSRLLNKEEQVSHSQVVQNYIVFFGIVTLLMACV